MLTSRSLALNEKVVFDIPLQDLRPYFELTDAGLLETIFFEGSRLLTEIVSSFGSWSYFNKWDKVAKNLFLGGLPSFGQSQQIINSANSDGGKLGLVVSVITIPQLAGIKVDPPSVWKKAGVRQIVLHMPDFTADTANEAIINTILQMHDCIQQGCSALVHCKAGKSRSAMMCLIYLYFFSDDADLHLHKDSLDVEENFKKIEDYLKQKRIQVEILDCQRDKAIEIIRLMEKMQINNRSHASEVNSVDLDEQKNVADKSTSPVSIEEIKEGLKSYINSLHVKNEIIQFSSFIALGYHAIGNQISALRKVINTMAYYLNFTRDEEKDSPQTKCIKEFFMQIYDAKADDINWYLDLVNSNGPLQNLIMMNSYFPGMWGNHENNKKERVALRNGFIEELNTYLANSLSCRVTDIEAAAKLLNQERKNLRGSCRVA